MNENEEKEENLTFTSWLMSIFGFILMIIGFGSEMLINGTRNLSTSLNLMYFGFIFILIGIIGLNVREISKIKRQLKED